MRFVQWILTAALAVAACGAAAQQDTARFEFGGDAFLAGQTIIHDAAGADDVFLAGQRVRIEADVTGSAHAAGQTVTLGGAVGRDAYVLGQEVTVANAIAGDLSVMGQDIRLSGDIGAALRAAGQNVELLGPVAGYAILGGENVRIDAQIAGDVSLAAQSVSFGDGASIGGTLAIYEEEIGRTEIPASVISADRITRHDVSEWEHDDWSYPVPTRRQMAGRFIGGVIMVALLAALIAALAPDRLADMRRMILAAPFRILGVGFLAQSALIGSTLLVALTLIGLLLVPAILVLAGVAALAGYVVGAYSFGVGLILMAGRSEPDDLAERAIAAGIGALVAGVLGLVPILGWIFVLALSLTGIGALVAEIFGLGRPHDPAPA